jgi:hypothetical protein
VDRIGWQHEYQRLLKAYGKRRDDEQSGEFFSALQGSTSAAVHDGVSACIREGKFFPTVADLLAAVRNASHRHEVPLATCDECQNTTWQEYRCDGVRAIGPETKPLPVDRAAYCGRDWVHTAHDYARRCRQCWTLTSNGGAV